MSVAKVDSSTSRLRRVQEAELAIISHVDHGLRLSREVSTFEKRSVERIEHGHALQVGSALQGAQHRCQQDVALQRPACLKNAWPQRFRELGDVLLKADSASQVLVEHDVQTFAQVLAHDRNLGLGHPRQVGIDDPPLKRLVFGAIEPLAQGLEGLKSSPKVRVPAELEETLGQIEPGIHAIKLVSEDSDRARRVNGLGSWSDFLIASTPIPWLPRRRSAHAAARQTILDGSSSRFTSGSTDSGSSRRPRQAAAVARTIGSG